MMLAIVQNPHVKDPSVLWAMLDKREATVDDDGIDREGLKRLKEMLKGGSKIKIKD